MTCGILIHPHHPICIDCCPSRVCHHSQPDLSGLRVQGHCDYGTACQRQAAYVATYTLDASKLERLSHRVTSPPDSPLNDNRLTKMPHEENKQCAYTDPRRSHHIPCRSYFTNSKSPASEHFIWCYHLWDTRLCCTLPCRCRMWLCLHHITQGKGRGSVF